jgi:hypothetical protein
MRLLKNPILYTIISLILIQHTLQEISLIQGKSTIKDSYIIPEGFIEFDLSHNINFNKLKYPITFDIYPDEDPSKKLNFGFTYRDSFAELQEETKIIKGFGDIAWVESVTKNLVIIVSKDKPKVLFRRIHGFTGFAGQFT